MLFARNEAPNNVALWPIAFASKSLIIMEIQYSNIDRSVTLIPSDTRHTPWPRNVSSLPFHL